MRWKDFASVVRLCIEYVSSFFPSISPRDQRSDNLIFPPPSQESGMLVGGKGFAPPLLTSLR